MKKIACFLLFILICSCAPQRNLENESRKIDFVKVGDRYQVNCKNISSEQFSTYVAGGWSQDGIYKISKDGVVSDYDIFQDLTGVSKYNFYVNTDLSFKIYHAMEHLDLPNYSSVNSMSYDGQTNTILFDQVFLESHWAVVLNIDDTKLEIIAQPWDGLKNGDTELLLYMFRRMTADEIEFFNREYPELHDL